MVAPGLMTPSGEKLKDKKEAMCDFSLTAEYHRGYEIRSRDGNKNYGGNDARVACEESSACH